MPSNAALVSDTYFSPLRVQSGASQRKLGCLRTTHDYGYRGLTAAQPFLNRAIYAGNMVGAVGLIIGTVVLLWGAYGAL